MPKYNYNLRHTEAGRSAPIYLVVRWNRRKLVYPAGEAIDPQHWCTTPGQRNFQRARETQAFPEHPEFNRHLDRLELTAKDTFRQFESMHGRIPEPAELRNALDRALNREGGGAPQEFQGYVELFIRKAADRIQPTSGQKMAVGTIRKYRTTLNALLEFARARNRSLSFTGIDLEFYEAFTRFLTVDKKLAPNTVGGRIKTLKVFMNAATEDGINTNRAFQTRRFRAPVEITDKVYLNETELNDLYHLDLSSNKRLERVRDRFLIAAWTGLRFGDLNTLQPEEIQGDRLNRHMAKTGRKVVIPVNAIVRAILDKYADEGNGLPPRLSNQKMNDYLKETCRMVPSLCVEVPQVLTIGGMRVRKKASKWELITTHTARRSFASNLYLKGVPARTIMAMTGHRTEQAFLAYIRLSPEEHANILDKFLEPDVKLKAL